MATAVLVLLYSRRDLVLATHNSSPLEQNKNKNHCHQLQPETVELHLWEETPACSYYNVRQDELERRLNFLINELIAEVSQQKHMEVDLFHYYLC